MYWVCINVLGGINVLRGYYCIEGGGGINVLRGYYCIGGVITVLGGGY